MCIIFHKWSKWSNPTAEKWIRLPEITSATFGADGHHYEREIQRRHCMKCGKQQKRYID